MTSLKLSFEGEGFEWCPSMQYLCSEVWWLTLSQKAAAGSGAPALAAVVMAQGKTLIWCLPQCPSDSSCLQEGKFLEKLLLRA